MSSAVAFKSLRVLFLLRRTNFIAVQDKIVAEFKQYTDIWQDDFVDTYRNITNKGIYYIVSLRWPVGSRRLYHNTTVIRRVTMARTERGCDLQSVQDDVC